MSDRQPARFRLYDFVALPRGIPDHDIEPGSVGMVGMIHNVGERTLYDVEVTVSNGSSAARVTVDDADLEPAQTAFHAYDVVRILRDFADRGIPRGSVGTIVMVYNSPTRAYEVEVLDSTLRDALLVTVVESDMELMKHAPGEESHS